MNHRLLASSATIARWRPLTAATAAVVVLAMAVTVLLAPGASAASTTPGDFSSVVGVQNPYVFWVDDCKVEVGVVFDSWPRPRYRLIGGVRVNCLSRHRVIDATVALYYYNGSQWVQYLSSAYGVRYNQMGTGYDQHGILRTPSYCVHGSGAYWWRVGATVRTERFGRTDFSPWANDPGASCSG